MFSTWITNHVNLSVFHTAQMKDKNKIFLPPPPMCRTEGCPKTMRRPLGIDCLQSPKYSWVLNVRL